MSIQSEISLFLKDNINEYAPSDHSVKVDVKSNNQFELDYYTVWHNDWNDKCHGLPLFKIIGESPYSQNILKLTINAKDKGINGTQNWELTGLLKSKNIFENLNTFVLPLNSNKNHNRIIVTYNDFYDENNGIGLLLNKCPHLKELVVPSAPGKKFFKREFHVLESLTIQTGYNHQNFIKNLANSNCFKKLKNIIFTDYLETYANNFEKHCTKYEDYLLLVRTQKLPSLKSLTIKYCILDDNQKEHLLQEAVKNDIQLVFD